MAFKRIIFNQGPTSNGSGGSVVPALALGEPGISTDQHFGLIGTGTNDPHRFQTTHTLVEMDFSDTPGVIQKRYKANPLSTPTAPAYQTNKNTLQPSGICEPADGEVGIVVKGVLIARFTPTGLSLSGALTYTAGGGVILSYGTTAQRPDTPIHGFIRHNTTLDVVEMWDGTTWQDLTGGGGGSGLAPWTSVTSTYTAQAGERLIANTDGGAFTITLPIAPTNGAEIWILGDFAARNLTIARNGKQIARKSEDLILNKDNIGLKLVYDNAITSWRLMP